MREAEIELAKAQLTLEWLGRNLERLQASSVTPEQLDEAEYRVALQVLEVERLSLPEKVIGSRTIACSKCGGKGTVGEFLPYSWQPNTSACPQCDGSGSMVVVVPVTTGQEGVKQVAKTNVEIKDMAFVPATVSIKAGDCVCFTNCDTMVHTVTDDAPAAKTKKCETSGDIQPNASYDRTYAVAGTFPYHCEKHAAMKGTVTVS